MIMIVAKLFKYENTATQKDATFIHFNDIFSNFLHKIISSDSTIENVFTDEERRPERPL